MFTVALIGPDGCGKSTISRYLCEVPPVPLRYVYMGVNLESSNLVLPTTWLVLTVKRLLGRRPDMAGPPDPHRTRSIPVNPLKRGLKSLKTSLRIANLMAEEWFRQLVVWYYQRRGYVVLFDRHFFCDYYAYDIAYRGPGRPLMNRLHGWMLDHLYPKPDLIIYLDAPAQLLFQRKGEGSPELLECRRREYLLLREVVPHFEQVDVTGQVEESCRKVADLILAYQTRFTDAGPEAKL